MYFLPLVHFFECFDSFSYSIASYSVISSVLTPHLSEVAPIANGIAARSQASFCYFSDNRKNFCLFSEF
jgi:hypothetical protein